jgi:hypothetical protein
MPQQLKAVDCQAGGRERSDARWSAGLPFRRWRGLGSRAMGGPMSVNAEGLTWPRMWFQDRTQAGCRSGVRSRRGAGEVVRRVELARARHVADGVVHGVGLRVDHA